MSKVCCVCFTVLQCLLCTWTNLYVNANTAALVPQKWWRKQYIQYFMFVYFKSSFFEIFLITLSNLVLHVALFHDIYKLQNLRMRHCWLKTHSCFLKIQEFLLVCACLLSYYACWFSVDQCDSLILRQKYKTKFVTALILTEFPQQHQTFSTT